MLASERTHVACFVVGSVLTRDKEGQRSRQTLPAARFFIPRQGRPVGGPQLPTEVVHMQGLVFIHVFPSIAYTHYACGERSDEKSNNLNTPKLVLYSTTATIGGY